MRSIIFWTFALIVLWHFTAKADDYSIRGGPSIQGKPDGTAKYFGVRKESNMVYGLRNAMEVGGWVDSGEGRKSALVVKYQLGVSPGASSGVFTSAFVGPCLISATDSLLGGNGQFCTDVGIGTRDSTGMVRFGYSHISSAGLFRPNRGRDFLTLEMGLRF